MADGHCAALESLLCSSVGAEICPLTVGDVDTVSFGCTENIGAVGENYRRVGHVKIKRGRNSFGGLEFETDIDAAVRIDIDLGERIVRAVVDHFESNVLNIVCAELVLIAVFVDDNNALCHSARSQRCQSKRNCR